MNITHLETDPMKKDPFDVYGLREESFYFALGTQHGITQRELKRVQVFDRSSSTTTHQWPAAALSALILVAEVILQSYHLISSHLCCGIE